MAIALRRVITTKTYMTLTAEDGGEYEVELVETKAPLPKSKPVAPNDPLPADVGPVPPIFTNGPKHRRGKGKGPKGTPKQW